MSDLSDVTFVEQIIRDGSYASTFTFDTGELRELLRHLDRLSFVDMIDVGPGTGLGTREPAPVPSPETHLQIAAEVVSDTDITTMILPSVAGKEEIDLLASYADTVDLIRIGVDADNVSAAAGLLEACESLDIEVALNLLKTYLVLPAEAADAATIAAEYDVDVVYVVDSAGGMVPDEVNAYITQISERTDTEVGFHGHNNLGWGLQNSIAAVDAGATYLDASLQGIGRSAGNAQTELVCANSELTLQREDWRRLLETESLLDNMYPDESGVSVTDVLYGLAQFHSSFEPDLRTFADEQDTRFIDLLLFAAVNDLATMQEVRNAYPPNR